jgi:hypothetical protein
MNDQFSAKSSVQFCRPAGEGQPARNICETTKSQIMEGKARSARLRLALARPGRGPVPGPGRIEERADAALRTLSAQGRPERRPAGRAPSEARPARGNCMRPRRTLAPPLPTRGDLLVKTSHQELSRCSTPTCFPSKVALLSGGCGRTGNEAGLPRHLLSSARCAEAAEE